MFTNATTADYNSYTNTQQIMEYLQHTLSFIDWQNVSIAFPTGMEGCVVNYGTSETLAGLPSGQNNDKRTVMSSDNISEG